jgi:predicted Rdx family selenoprotein
MVAIYTSRSTAECFVFLGHGLDTEHVCRSTGGLYVIIVDDLQQIGKLTMTGKHGGFPGIAFLQFTIREQAINLCIVTFVPFSPCDTQCL